MNLDWVQAETRGRGSLTIIHDNETRVFCPGEPIPVDLRREVDQALREGRATVEFRLAKGDCDEAN